MKDLFESLIKLFFIALVVAFVALVIIFIICIPFAILGGVAFAIGYCAHLGWSFF